MKARYQYRIYPTAQQQKELARVFGCCRVVYNDALALCKQSDKVLSSGDLQKVCITQAKKTEQRSWLSEVSNIPLPKRTMNQAIAHLPEPEQLALSAPLPLTQHPAAVYLSQLAPKSRRTMRQSLNAIASEDV